MNAQLTAALLILYGASACTPTPSAAPAPAIPSTPASASQADEIVVRTNGERKALGLPLLVRSAALMKAAQLQADQMAALKKMSHDLPGSEYPTLDSRLGAVQYRSSAAAENIAEGYPSAAAVVAGWMTSPGHRENIVSPKYSEMGAGVATSSNGRRFYAQVFGRPR